MPGTNQISGFRSIKFQFFITIILTVGIVAGVLGIVIYQDDKHIKTNQLTELANLTAERLSEHLVVPVWDVDRLQVDRLLESEMNEKRIDAIKVFDEDRISLLSARARNITGNIIPLGDNEVGGDLVRAEEEINNSGQAIGSVVVYFNKNFLQKELRQRLIEVGILALALALILSIIMGISLNRLVIKPVIYLSEIAQQLSKGKLNQHIDIAGAGEIGVLAANLSRIQTSFRIAIGRLRKKQSESN